MRGKYLAEQNTLNEKSKNLIAFGMVAIIMILIFIFVPTLASDDAEKLYGTWARTDGAYEIYEFSPNGSVVLSNETVNFSGKYSVNGDKLHVQLADREADCTFYFDGDILVIVNQSGEQSRLEKVTDPSVITPAESDAEKQTADSK